MTRIVVFDVVETLLDLSALDPYFQDTFGDATARPEWFTQTLENALVSSVVGPYKNFEELGGAALRMVAERRGVTLGKEAQQGLKDGLLHLPAHPDARPALERLRERGVRLATLTNSLKSASEAQLRFAGLRDLPEQVLSADEVRRLKPAREPYEYAAGRLGTDAGGLWLVAAHAWDVAGASGAGCKAAFVGRPGKVPDPTAPRPDVIGADLMKVAAGILAAEGLG